MGSIESVGVLTCCILDIIISDFVLAASVSLA